GNPGKLVPPSKIDGSGGRITGSEGHAARAIRPDIGIAVQSPVIEADVVTADRAPAALLAQSNPERARLMRCREGLIDLEAEIADAAALADQHERGTATLGTRDEI